MIGFRNTNLQSYVNYEQNNIDILEDQPQKIEYRAKILEFVPVEVKENQKNLLKKLVPEEVVNYITDYIPRYTSRIKFLETSSRFDINNLQEEKIDCLVNLRKVNNIRYLNKFFESVNNKLTNNGTFIGRVETTLQRRSRIFNKYPLFISYVINTTDFIFNRILPKTKFTKRLYFQITGARYRAVSLPEILGRLVACGFKIEDYQEINNQTYFAVKKITKPAYDMNPSYGPIFKMKRIGLNGRIIQVYKLRTMHPYSEYLQSYVYNKNKLDSGGKFKDDFRVTAWGKLFRKLWIDELPMLINLIKGDLKLVGVRPISHHYLNLYNDDIRERRIKYKPGLIPPFYADNPKTLDEIMDSERKYLDAYDINPLITDFKYFFTAWYNILIKKMRSA